MLTSLYSSTFSFYDTQGAKKEVKETKSTHDNDGNPVFLNFCFKEY